MGVDAPQGHLDDRADEPASAPARGTSRPSIEWASTAKGVVLVFLVFLLCWYLLSPEKLTAAKVQDFVADYGAWGLLVFGALYTVVAATPLPVSAMALAGGYLFGVVLGIPTSLTASVVGALGGYWLARFLGHDVLRRFLGDRISAVEERLEGSGFLMVLSLRLIPMFPFWAVNYGSGLVKVPQREFLVATVVGGAAGQISLVALGAFAAQPRWEYGAVAVAGWTLMALLGVWAWRQYRRERRRRGARGPAGP